MPAPASTQMTAPARVLTGDRPTGRLHLGHLVGTLQQCVQLQSQYDMMPLVADLHTLTTRVSRADASVLAESVRGIVLDYLACGIDPGRCGIFLQSAVPEIPELYALLANLVTVCAASPPTPCGRCAPPWACRSSGRPRPRTCADRTNS